MISITALLAVGLVGAGFRPARAVAAALAAATGTVWPTPPAWLKTVTPTSGPTPTPYPTLPAWLKTVVPTPGASPTPPAGLPGGFSLLDAAPGVQLYRKDYPGGSPDFVQLIDLSQGAQLTLLHGQITDPRPQKGVYGGADPRMTALALDNYWLQMRATDPDLFCLTNGTFFYMPEYPTRLAFPLKVNGEMVTDGWGIDTYVGEKLILELWPDHAQIHEMNGENLYSSMAPDIVGGLTEEANKRAKRAVGRTFFGLDDRNGDGQFEIVLTLNTSTAVQTGAAQVLRDFGADQVIMLDGGGSTQLLCRSGWHIRSDRPIPEAIAVSSAKPPPVAMRLVSRPGWQTLVQGEGLPLDIEIENSGTVSWTAGTTRLVLELGELGGAAELPAPGVTLPGQMASFTYTTPVLSQPGIFPIEVRWGLRYGDKTYTGEPLHLQAAVLPEALRSKRAELETELKRWVKDQPQQAPALVERWLAQQSAVPPSSTPSQQPAPAPATPARAARAHLTDLLLIPLLMLPVILILVVVVERLHRR